MQANMKVAVEEAGVDLLSFSILGMVTFALSMLLLYISVHLLHIEKYISVVFSYGAASVTHYYLSRWLIFTNTKRSVDSGLMYFLLISAFDAAVIVVGIFVLQSLWNVDLYIARAVMAGVVGVLSFYLNAHFNFRSL
jgi:putative flippase GtrA